MAYGGWGSKKNGVRLGCFWDDMEYTSDGSQARIIGAKIRIDRDVNIDDSSNKLSWSGGAVSDGSDSNINVDGSGAKTIKNVTGQWQTLSFDSTVSWNFAASMSGINYAGATISNSESVTYPRRYYLVPTAPTNVDFSKISPGNYTIVWNNNSSAIAPWQYLLLRRVDSYGNVYEEYISPSLGAISTYGLYTDRQYYWTVIAINSSGSASNSTGWTSIELHTITNDKNSVNIGDSVTFYINKYGSSNISKLYVTVNGTSRLLYEGDGSQVTRQFAKADWAPYITTKNSETYTFRLETYSGSTYLGVNYTTITVVVPAGSPYDPVAVIPTMEDKTLNIQTSFDVFIKNASSISYTCNGGTPGEYATIVKRELIIRRPSQSQPSIIPLPSNSKYEEIPVNAGTITVACRITDSRGRINTSADTSILVYDRDQPKITTFEAIRCDINDTPTNVGEYVKFKIKVAANSIKPITTEQNRMGYDIYLLNSNGNPYGSAIYSRSPTAVLADDFTTGHLGGPYSSKNAYGFILSTYDRVDLITSSMRAYASSSISSEVYPLTIGNNGIAIGKIYNDPLMALDVVGNMRVSSRVGVIEMFAGATPPAKALICDGSSLSTTMYADLFAVIGYTFGGSGGSFNIPNLKGKVPTGVDSSQTEFSTIGKTGGEKAHTLTTSEMPSHTHIQDSHNHSQDAHTHSVSGTNNFLRWVGSGGNRANTTGTLISGDGLTIYSAQPYIYPATPTNQYTGGGGSHNVLQPYVALNFIIWY